MKRLTVLSLVGVCACAGSSRALGSHAIAGPWHGVLVKGGLRSVVDFRFTAGEGGSQGFYWGRELAPIPLTQLRIGSSIHFEVPRMAVFDGTAGVDTIEGTFRD